MKIKREDLYAHLIEKNFNQVEKTTFDALLDENWKTEWKVDREVYNKFRKYAIGEIKKTLKVNTNKAKDIFDWFYWNHGIIIED